MRKFVALMLFVGAFLFAGGFSVSLSSEKTGVVIPTPLTKNVGEYYVSIGVFSIAELEKNFPRAYKLLVKHHGKPSRNHTHHLAVSIWKEEKGKEVFLSDYEVEAEVRSPLLRATRKKLTKYPHQYGDNYGGWFDMSDKGLYHIAVIIHENGKTKRVTFDYLMQ
ncbi:hypothetical protein [Hydrogenivirga sp. 128-5-R1-1]|uniref:hypothetical protein n=1 Tax=Hydrogenivirga sp. 128-5-R1-1 TaxID=392423 RepID=UPI00015EF148|nr:hypothetical protein [Hydrogenivirga sp. 128-5-R1-1]EDP74711.1 hypothetical protein HG1285_14904 [Hydrogenivirga sp. 128-5-R1-1]